MSLINVFDESSLTPYVAISNQSLYYFLSYQCQGDDLKFFSNFRLLTNANFMQYACI